MTFCRRGNDYADVAQPFPLTGGSHGGGGDTVDVASETSDRHVPSPPPCSTLPLVLSLAFSWMMEEPLSSTPFKTTKSLCWSNQIQEYFHLMSKRIFQNDQLLWQLCSWILPLESGNNLGLSEPPRDLCYPSCYLINRFPKENVTCKVTSPPASRCLAAPSSNDGPGSVDSSCPLASCHPIDSRPSSSYIHFSSSPPPDHFSFHIKFFFHPPPPFPHSLRSAAGFYLTGNIPGDVAWL